MRSRRGMTLIEVMVGATIAIIMTAAAVVFATQQTRLMDLSQDKLQTAQEGRAALALLAEDMRKAGAGVGYNEAGEFLGLESGPFTIGGTGFNPLGAVTPDGAADPGTYAENSLSRRVGAAYTVRTHDIRITVADGGYSTIAAERGGVGYFCVSPEAQFDAGEMALMRDQTGISARLGTLAVSGAPVVLNGALGSSMGTCSCLGGCQRFTFTPDASPNFSGVGAGQARYGFGELQGGFRRIAWYVGRDADGVGELRRLDYTAAPPCVSRDQCEGGTVAYDAEALHSRVWRFDPTAGNWVPTGGEPIAERDQRLRVDLELVLRSPQPTDGFQEEVTSRLWPGECVPGPCGAATDRYRRSVYRTSVEIMNSGMMKFR